LSTSEPQPEAAVKPAPSPRAAEEAVFGAAGAPPAPSGPREPHSRLYPDALEKVCEIFGKHLADVLDRHRKVEVLTGEKNVVGRQNLVEALAHLSVLFARAPELDRDKQLEQVAYLGDHLRRVMMESFEVEVYATIGAHWNDKDPNSIGRRYDAVAAPLVKRGQLLGVISPEEVQARLDGLSARIVQARRAKIADGDWTAWIDAADDLEWAAKEMRTLKREMGAAVDAAASVTAAEAVAPRFHFRLMLIGVGLSALAGVGGTLLVQALT
jgi:hypothetical protein